MTTFTSLPGMNFNETVTQSTINVTESNVPLFIVQTSTAIETLDNTITYFEQYDTFATIADGKGLTNTLKYIEDVLLEYGYTSFYVYSIKTDTSLAFTDAVKSTSHLDDVNSITYVEETKSSNNNPITSKIAAIKNGVVSNAENGSFRIAYIIPYGTVADAVNNKNENVTSEQAVITTLTSTLNSQGNGRVCVVVPDENAGLIVGKCLATGYTNDPGLTPLETAIQESSYNFDATQMLTILNLGVLFLRKEKYYGGYRERICLGVTTAAKDNLADKYIISRAAADAVLNRIHEEGSPLVKAKELEENEKSIQTIVDTIVDDFVEAGNIYRDGTMLSVTGDGESFQIDGEIKAVKCAKSINVNTTLA